MIETEDMILNKVFPNLTRPGSVSGLFGTKKLKSQLHQSQALTYSARKIDAVQQTRSHAF